MSKKISQATERMPSNAGEASVPPIAIVLLIAIALLIGANVYTFLELKALRTEVAEQIQVHDEKIAMLDGSVARTSSTIESKVGEVKTLVESAEQQIDRRARQVESKVLGRTDNLQKELEETRANQAAKISEVGTNLQNLQSDTESKVGSLDGRVTTVKEEVEKTKAELDKTIADLSSVKGDLGVQSGLIATNGGELEALKRLGERNYYEFDMGKTKQPQKVGPIRIKLTGADEKKNRYSLELWADDKRIQKRRKTLLEPVQFYVMGSRVPYELVVNKINKNKIGGYLATPLDTPRAAAAGSSE